MDLTDIKFDARTAIVVGTVIASAVTGYWAITRTLDEHERTLAKVTAQIEALEKSNLEAVVTLRILSGQKERP